MLFQRSSLPTISPWLPKLRDVSWIPRYSDFVKRAMNTWQHQKSIVPDTIPVSKKNVPHHSRPCQTPHHTLINIGIIDLFDFFLIYLRLPLSPCFACSCPSTESRLSTVSSKHNWLNNCTTCMKHVTLVARAVFGFHVADKHSASVKHHPPFFYFIVLL